MADKKSTPTNSDGNGPRENWNEITLEFFNLTPLSYEAFFLGGINLKRGTDAPDNVFEFKGPLSDTRGSLKATATANGAANTSQLPLGFEQEVVPEALELYATTIKPNGWDNTPGTVAHNWTLNWDCCCLKKCLTMHTEPRCAIDVTVCPGADSTCPLQIPIYR